MKHIANLLPEGFIVDNEYNHTIGEMIKQRDAAIIALAGDKAIISGVEADGLNTTAGVVTYAGKLYKFIGGVTQANITTKKVNYDRPNNAQVLAPAFYEDIIEFGNDGDETFLFADLTRFYPNQPKFKKIEIYGRNITNEELAGTGWFLANGANGTDNLVDKYFVVAGGDHTVASTVGSKSKTITAGNLPTVGSGLFVGQEGNGYPDAAAGTLEPPGANHTYPRKTKELNLSDFGANDEALDITPLSFSVVAIQFIGI